MEEKNDTHWYCVLFEELPFLIENTQNIDFKSVQNLGGKNKNASARNVLLGCIFLYIHICFYT